MNLLVITKKTLAPCQIFWELQRFKKRLSFRESYQINSNLVIAEFYFDTLGQKSTFCPEITKNLMFEYMNFVKK